MRNNCKNIMERRIRLRTLNNYVTCFLCKGYLVDATTITECLHTFCKTCIVKHLREHVTCPRCENVIHQSHPLNFISHDRTMQDIVYKLVPGLQEEEMEKEEEFYKKRGLPVPRPASVTEENSSQSCQSSSSSSSSSDSSKSSTPVSTSSATPPDEEIDYHRQDEQVNICLVCQSHQLKSLKRKFIRCSSQATITHLKKFITMKIFNNIGKFKGLDVMLNNEILGKDHTLKFIWVTRWRLKQPLELHYRPRVEL